MSSLWLISSSATVATAEVGRSAFSASESYLTTLLGLALVLALILVLAWLAKRLQLPLANQGPLQVIASMPLGPKERLLVVEVGQQQLLLATGSGGTRLLTELTEPLPPRTSQPLAGSFASLLDNYKKQSQ
ncbi:flagellar biosynthetic protein FliO [Ferrimonas senticii]|uniref:flagellar biosynthetic protein FliO n=1 Tax=Ferrimonas senticii TaxID=394566 RepID=UPI00042696E2|nr:flagellar biosynthetic protein FliO [Ferrimonas senticii]